jgi:hypothetical protein
MSWYDLKELMGTYTGLERDALHVHGALFLYLIAMVVLRQGRRSLLPWLIVLAAELTNEFYDAWYNWGEALAWIWESSAKDLWNTMLWPTVLLLLGRYSDWFQRPPPAEAQP